MSLVTPVWNPPDLITLCQTALFFVLPVHCLQHVYLVVTVSKVLQGDVEIVSAPYCFPKKYTTNPTELERVRERAREGCLRLGKYQQVRG